MNTIFLSRIYLQVIIFSVEYSKSVIKALTMSEHVLDNTVLAYTPALAAPPGMQSNLVDPPRPLLPVSIVTYSICLFLVLLSAGIRTYTKACIMKSLQGEDCMLLADACSLVTADCIQIPSSLRL